MESSSLRDENEEKSSSLLKTMSFLVTVLKTALAFLALSFLSSDLDGDINVFAAVILAVFLSCIAAFFHRIPNHRTNGMMAKDMAYACKYGIKPMIPWRPFTVNRYIF